MVPQSPKCRPPAPTARAPSVMAIRIEGYPMPGQVTIAHPQTDTSIHGTGWLLDVDQVRHLLDAWKHAPAGDSDVRREWVYYDHGLFVTALYLGGELSISSWEAADGSDGNDRYSTVTMPFEFTVRPVHPTTPRERFRLTDTDPHP